MTLSSTVIESKDRFPNAFVGFFSKDVDPPNQEYPASSTKVLNPDGTIKGDSPGFTWDFGDDVIFIPTRLRIPTEPANLDIVVQYQANGNQRLAVGGSAISVIDNTFQDLMDAYLGGASVNGSRDGTFINEIRITVEETSGSPNTADIGTIRLRGMLFLKGSGAAI